MWGYFKKQNETLKTILVNYSYGAKNMACDGLIEYDKLSGECRLIKISEGGTDKEGFFMFSAIHNSLRTRKCIPEEITSYVIG